MPRTIVFEDFPEFRPNLTPKQIFDYGSFGGTYWRPIYSSVTKKDYKNVHHKYDFFDSIPEYKMSVPCAEYDKYINKYKVKVGVEMNKECGLKFWEKKKWITKHDPYGWVQWYTNFYDGRRSPDDDWQIDRWKKTAGPNSRFRRRLINMINKKRTDYDDCEVSPAIRQTLQHWAYKLVDDDLN